MIEYVNPAFEEITGYDRSDAIGETPRPLDAGEMPEDHFEGLWATLLSGDGWGEEIVNRRANGELYHARRTVAPVVEEGEVGRFVAVQIDITERKGRDRRLQVLARPVTQPPKRVERDPWAGPDDSCRSGRPDRRGRRTDRRAERAP